MPLDVIRDQFRQFPACQRALARLRFIRAGQAIGLTLGDIATLLDFGEDRTASRDFVDERLAKIRTRKQEIEARLADLAKFRDVLEEDTLEQWKEFLHGFIAGIEIDPDTARGTMTFHELPAGSLMMELELCHPFAMWRHVERGPADRRAVREASPLQVAPTGRPAALAVDPRSRTMAEGCSSVSARRLLLEPERRDT